MKTWIYSWFIYPLSFFIVSFFSIFHRKTRRTLRLRSWKNFLSMRFNPEYSIEYWIHVASVGELEYAIPLIEDLQAKGKRVLVTYYSISAKERVEKLPEQFLNVSLVVPLPHDGLGLMRDFVNLVYKQGVRCLLLMKYELWPGLLWECQKNRIAIVLVNALRPGWFHRKLIHKVDLLIAGYEREIESLDHRGKIVLGDTRAERVVSRICNSQKVLSTMLEPAILEFFLRSKTLILGSSWPKDDDIVLNSIEELIKRKISIIWVPHEIEGRQIKRIRNAAIEVGYETIELNANTKLTENEICSNNPKALIVTCKGILVELYGLATWAFVGGGWGEGVHSVWEPALSGLLVACGPNRVRSPESYYLETMKALSVIHNSNEFLNWLNIYGATSKNLERANILGQRHLGSSKRIVDYVEHFLEGGKN